MGWSKKFCLFVFINSVHSFIYVSWKFCFSGVLSGWKQNGGGPSELGDAYHLWSTAVYLYFTHCHWSASANGTLSMSWMVFFIFCIAWIFLIFMVRFMFSVVFFSFLFLNAATCHHGTPMEGQAHISWHLYSWAVFIRGDVQRITGIVLAAGVSGNQGCVVWLEFWHRGNCGGVDIAVRVFVPPDRPSDSLCKNIFGDCASDSSKVLCSCLFLVFLWCLWWWLKN